MATRNFIPDYQGLHVGFGEASPEAKAAKNLHNFFTYVAVRIVTAQLEVPPLLVIPLFILQLNPDGVYYK